MSSKPIHVVFTTIFTPEVLAALAENLERYGHLDRVKVWVIGDRKTPEAARLLSAQATRRGLETEYLDIEAQDHWGRGCLPFYSRLPYNNETRRNIGYLRALEAGCETLIAIDDDNFPTDGDFIGGHLRTGRPWDGEVVSESTGFHNLCEYLTFEPARMIFPRGYPFNLRGAPNRPERISARPGTRVGVTAGLWLREPDIDATTWLNGKVTATAFTGPDLTVLDPTTWTPINTQNTSVTRDLIPAFLCVPMGHEVPGGKIQRYGDIWGGYFLQAVMQNTSYAVGFGRPLVDHRRNPHNYVDDLRHEFWGMILTDWLIDLLRTGFRPSAPGIVDRVGELAEFLRADATPQLPAWAPEAMRQFLFGTADNLSAWAEACRPFAVASTQLSAPTLRSPFSPSPRSRNLPITAAAELQPKRAA